MKFPYECDKKALECERAPLRSASLVTIRYGFSGLIRSCAPAIETFEVFFSSHHLNNLFMTLCAVFIRVWSPFASGNMNNHGNFLSKYIKNLFYKEWCWTYIVWPPNCKPVLYMLILSFFSVVFKTWSQVQESKQHVFSEIISQYFWNISLQLLLQFLWRRSAILIVVLFRASMYLKHTQFQVFFFKVLN